MPTKTEGRILELLENLLLVSGGAGIGAAIARPALARTAAEGVATSPVARAIILGNLANEAARKAEMSFLEAEGIDPGIAFSRSLQPLQREQMLLLDPKVRTGVKRKISKANKAVQHAVSLLKAGTKRSTGADKGKLSKGYWKVATRAAGLANPNTTSSIGKGKSITKALARKLKKWWK